MNKILIAALLTLCFCELSFLSPRESNAQTYEVFKGLMAGLSQGGVPAKCVSDINNGSVVIAYLFEDAKRRFYDGENFQEVLVDVGIKLIQIKGILTNCKLIDLYSAASKTMTKDGLTSLSNQIRNNIPALLTAGANLKTAMNDKHDYNMGYNGGVIARLLLNTFVN